MKVGVIDDFFVKYPPEKRLRRIAEMGFEGVQLWLTCFEMGFDLEGGTAAWFSNDYRPSTRSLSKGELRRILAETGLTVSQLGPHYALGRQPSPREASTGTFSSKAEERARIADFERLIDCAADLEVRMVGVMSGGDPKVPQHWQHLVEIVKELADHAKSRGVILTIENLGDWQMLVADEHALLRLVNDVGSNNLKVNFDPKNLNQVRRNPDVPGAVRRLGSLIVHTHAGDSVYGEGSKAPIGTGTVPFPEYIAALREVGFDGWLQMEAMKTEEQFLESKRYLEEIIQSSGSKAGR